MLINLALMHYSELSTPSKRFSKPEWVFACLHVEFPASSFAERSLTLFIIFISQAMYGWGNVLRTYYGKNHDLMYEDPTVKYLGFWTDNGKCIVCHGR